MNSRLKILYFFSIGLITLSTILIVPILAFSTDSFSQDVGDEYIWEVEFSDGTSPFIMPIIDDTGERIRLVVIELNQTENGGIEYDTVWFNLYSNTSVSTNWTYWSYSYAQYNSSYGLAMHLFNWIYPHNETTVNESMSILLCTNMGFQSYKWESGPHGYDGKGVGWDGNETGEPGNLKNEFKFNAEGVCEYWRTYKGTATGWALIYELRLQSSSSIPGFQVIPMIIALNLCLAIYILQFRNRNKNRFLN